MKIFLIILIFLLAIGESPPAVSYIGLGPLIPIFGSFLIYLFVVLLAVIGVLAYPLKRIFNRLRTKKNDAADGVPPMRIGNNSLQRPTNKVTHTLTRITTAVLDYLAGLELLLLRRRLATKIYKPIFVSGLARSNTTLLTHILNSHPDSGSFLYKDLPFPSIPYFWSFFSASYYKGKSVEQRIHRDALWVDPDSPDAFEETIWKKRLFNYVEGDFCKFLDYTYENPALERALRDGIRIILHVRKRKTRYVSKGNYNLFRLKFILKLFPDAKFILCIRDPIQHSLSMARVHREFMKLAATDKSFGKKLSNLGHFEFGPNRLAVTVNTDGSQLTESYWDKGDDYKGYLQQWIDVYSFLLDHYLNDDLLKQHLLLVDYETFVADAKLEISRIADFCELENTNDFFEATIKKVDKKSHYAPPIAYGHQEHRALHVYASILSQTS